MFESAFREARRLLDKQTDLLRSRSVGNSNNSNNTRDYSATIGRVSMLLDRMSNELTKECERLGCWGVLGQGTGARLLNPTTGQPIDKEQLTGQ